MGKSVLGKILVVDDNHHNRLIAEAKLLGAGYEVVTVDSGAAAVSTFGQHAFELVLLDILMPGMDGFETCRRLRELPRGDDRYSVRMQKVKEKFSRKALDAGYHTNKTILSNYKPPFEIDWSRYKGSKWNERDGTNFLFNVNGTAGTSDAAFVAVTTPTWFRIVYDQFTGKAYPYINNTKLIAAGVAVTADEFPIAFGAGSGDATNLVQLHQAHIYYDNKLPFWWTGR